MAKITKMLRCKINEIFSEALLKDLDKVCNDKTIPDNNTKKEIIEMILGRYGVNYSMLGPGTNRVAVLVDNTVFKIAMDDWGKRDNLNEFAMTKELQPYVIKVYEVNTNGLVMSCDYVTVISKEEYYENKQTILEILEELSRGYLLGDVGYVMKNFMNWGYDNRGNLVILDFAYIYRIIGDEMLCNSPNCTTHPMLEYDSNYFDLRCPSCKRKYTFMDIRRRYKKEHEDELVEMTKKISYKTTDNKLKVEVEKNEKTSDELVKKEDSVMDSKNIEYDYSADELFERDMEEIRAKIEAERNGVTFDRAAFLLQWDLENIAMDKEDILKMYGIAANEPEDTEEVPVPEDHVKTDEYDYGTEQEIVTVTNIDGIPEGWIPPSKRDPNLFYPSVSEIQARGIKFTDIEPVKFYVPGSDFPYETDEDLELNAHYEEILEHYKSFGESVDSTEYMDEEEEHDDFDFNTSNFTQAMKHLEEKHSLKAGDNVGKVVEHCSFLDEFEVSTEDDDENLDDVVIDEVYDNEDTTEEVPADEPIASIDVNTLANMMSGLHDVEEEKIEVQVETTNGQEEAVEEPVNNIHDIYSSVKNSVKAPINMETINVGVSKDKSVPDFELAPPVEIEMEFSEEDDLLYAAKELEDAKREALQSMIESKEEEPMDDEDGVDVDHGIFVLKPSAEAGSMVIPMFKEEQHITMEVEEDMLSQISRLRGETDGN